MLELAAKEIEIVIIAVFYVLKKNSVETCNIFEKTKSDFKRWKLQCLRWKKLIRINEKLGFAEEKINKLEERATGTMKLSRKTQRKRNF